MNEFLRCRQVAAHRAAAPSRLVLAGRALVRGFSYFPRRRTRLGIDRAASRLMHTARLTIFGHYIRLVISFSPSSLHRRVANSRIKALMPTYLLARDWRFQNMPPPQQAGNSRDKM